MSIDFQGPKCGRCGSFSSPEMQAVRWEWLVIVNGRRLKYMTEESAKLQQCRTGGQLLRRPVGHWQEV